MPAKDLKIQVYDMDEEMKAAAEEQILKCFQSYSREEKIASEIKQFFDKNYNPAWNVVVGKNFGSHVINQTKCYMFASYKDDEMSILLWKSWTVTLIIVVIIFTGFLCLELSGSY